MNPTRRMDLTTLVSHLNVTPLVSHLNVTTLMSRLTVTPLTKWTRVATPPARWPIALTTLLVVALACGCSDEITRPVDTGTGSVTVGEISVLQGGLARSPLEGVWIAESGRIFVVGAGVAFTHDGQTWSRTPLPERNLGGIILRPWPLDVWGIADDDVYAAGRNGTMVHYDGTWSEMASPTSAHIHGIHGTGADDIWIASEDGLFHYDGNAWTDVTADVIAPLGAPCDGDVRDLRDVWTDGSRVFAVGVSGTSLVRENGEWTCSTDVEGGDLLAVSGYGATVYTVSTSGMVYGYCAPDWCALSAPAGLTELRDVVTERTAVTVVGVNGTIYRFNGLTWEDDVSGVDGDLIAVDGRAGVRVAVGADGLVTMRDAAGWTPAFDGERAVIEDVFGFATGEVFAVGSSPVGLPVWRFDGTDWAPHERGGGSAAPAGAMRPASAPIVLRGVWGSAPDDVFAVGQGGLVVHYDGDEWTQHAQLGTNLRAVWGFAPDDVFAVGDFGSIVHYDGVEWDAMPYPTFASFTDVWGAAPDDVYTVAGREILHYDGVEWSVDNDAASLESFTALRGIGDTVFAVGGGGFTPEGVVRQRIDGEWVLVATTPEVLYSVGVVAPDRVFLGGSDGEVMLFDGTSVHDVPAETYPQVLGIWGASESDVHLVGAPGTFMRYQR